MNYIFIRKTTKIIFALVSLSILFFISRLMLKGAGSGCTERQILLLMILIIFLSASRKAFWFLAFPMCLLYAIYYPIGSIFGEPSYQYVASVFAKDLLESKEFLMQIPTVNFIFPLIIILGILLYWFIINRYEIKLYKNKTIIIIFIVISMLDQSPAVFFKKTIKSFSEVYSELVKLNSLDATNEWGDVYLKDSKYNNYILIIGESARKDYHNAYGYPINNTPFMSSTNGFLVNGLKSGGTNTIASLRLMLTKPDTNTWDANYNLNFIDLVKSAGIKTYWVSNQGYFGEFDTPIAAIAKKSDRRFFVKMGDYASKNTSDFILLNDVKNIIENNNEKKLIVIHLYGSHPNACDRITDYKKIISITDNKYSYINCYISSINKTDDFIKEVNSLMSKRFKEYNETYSLLYFSDHGMAHREMDGVLVLNNNRSSIFHYDVPLFKISSDDKNRNECNSFKSGLNFINGLASWIGIRNDKLDSNYSLFDCTNDPDDFGLKKRIESTVNDNDPAIDIRGK